MRSRAPIHAHARPDPRSSNRPPRAFRSFFPTPPPLDPSNITSHYVGITSVTPPSSEEDYVNYVNYASNAFFKKKIFSRAGVCGRLRARTPARAHTTLSTFLLPVRAPRSSHPSCTTVTPVLYCPHGACRTAQKG